MTKYVLVLILAGILILTCGASTSFAREIFLGLDSNTYYDIYIGGPNENTSVIKNVQIVDIREHEDITFLIIRAASFGGKGSEGLVVLENIKAILPSHKFIMTQG